MSRTSNTDRLQAIFRTNEFKQDIGKIWEILDGSSWFNEKDFEGKYGFPFTIITTLIEEDLPQWKIEAYKDLPEIIKRYYQKNTCRRVSPGKLLDNFIKPAIKIIRPTYKKQIPVNSEKSISIVYKGHPVINKGFLIIRVDLDRDKADIVSSFRNLLNKYKGKSQILKKGKGVLIRKLSSDKNFLVVKVNLMGDRLKLELEIERLLDKYVKKTKRNKGFRYSIWQVYDMHIKEKLNFSKIARTLTGIDDYVVNNYELKKSHEAVKSAFKKAKEFIEREEIRLKDSKIKF
ncbi:MAG: hypothetical protein L6Q53_02660 [Candidatus Brocadia sinica]|nr:hypothetical protein [Candidatus Brocadia sinica]